MNRLTEKRKKPLVTKWEDVPTSYYSIKGDNTGVLISEIGRLNKLGSLEDLLDQYNVKDLKELDKLLEMATSYEELSKQIGCPLEVFFKLVKQVKINFNGTMSGYFVFYNLLTKRFEIRNEETMDFFPLTDYKKKFWLREDKSE